MTDKTEPALCRKCPGCGQLVMADDRGMYHQRPSCEWWSAKMVELGASPGEPIEALVVRIGEIEEGN